MKIDKKLQNLSLLIICFIGIVGLFIGRFFDRQISSKVIDETNLFAALFIAFGVLGTLSLGSFAATALYFAPKQNNRYFNIFIRIIGVLAFLFFNFFEIREGSKFTNYFPFSEDAIGNKVLFIVLVILIDIIIILFTKVKIKRFDTSILIETCLMIIAIIAIYSGLDEVIKYVASRPRPYLNEFKNWYEFNPLFAIKAGNDYKSFLSGHTCNACCCISIIPLVLSLNKNQHKRTQLIGIIIGSLYGLVVGFSRLIIGAHFLSDVSGALILSACVQLFVINIRPKIIKFSTK